jgi:hypothetical protein
MKIIQQANKAARENARSINGVIKRDAKRVTEIIKSLQRAGVKPYNVTVDYSSYNVWITGTRADLDIMFGVLRRAGLRPSRRPEEKNTYYATFWYWDESESGYVFVTFSSTSCKRVQVGTKMEEVPVYETVCEE